MPRQALDHPAVREQVRLLYIANGRNLTAAAKTAGIPVDRAEKWKERGLWDQSLDLQNTKQFHLSESVGKIADSLANELNEQGRKTKSHISHAALKAATTFSEMEGAKVIDKSDRLMNITKVASIIHGWQDTQATSALNLNVLSGGRAIVQVNPSTSSGLEASEKQTDSTSSRQANENSE